MEYLLPQIANILGISVTGNLQHSVQYLLTDSRNVAHPEHSLFIAIKGDRHNGHQYINELYHLGVRSFLIDESVDFSKFPEAGFLVVANTLYTFQELCAWHRKQFNIPVIGITGSNGKTVVKEWLYQLLKDDFNICRSPKSYNSQIGVPLSVWQLNAQHTLAIFEAGISKPNEMARLQKIILPTIGVITNIGNAHDEGFSNTEEKLKEKLLLFASSSTVVYCLDNDKVHSKLKNRNSFTWSKVDKHADLYISAVNILPATTEITADYKNKSTKLIINYTDQASVENAITCWATLLQLGYNDSVIAERMLLLHPVAMRLEMKQGINNSLVINDSYNSDLGSLAIALDFLNQQKQHQQKTIVLSDILQSGISDEDLYKKVASLLKSKGVNALIGIGPAISSFSSLFQLDKRFFLSTDDFLKSFYSLQFNFFSNKSILLKGARAFKFENINTVLQQKSHDTVLEINLNHLVNNINYFKTKLKPSTKLMAMVKASSYGSGSHEIASCLQHQRVDYLAVAYADEGVELRKAGISIPIMVMSPEEQAFEDIVNYRLEPEIFSFRILLLFCSFLENNNYPTWPIHLKIDTGMHRLGFEEKEIPELLNLLNKKASFIKVSSCFSHLAASSNQEFDSFTREQINLFKHLSEKICSLFNYPILKHICNSGGISRFPEAHFDMVRLGIGMYGVGINAEEQKQLKNVSSLKTSISQLKKLQNEETVGYNRNGKIDRESKIATVPIGYADGLSRALGNKNGYMFVKGKKAPIIGSVCMDMCMLDVTNIDCNEGDEVVVFDTVERLNSLASLAKTIPYEILTSVSQRVKRIYVQE